MNSILDQQHEFQMKQASNSNMRCGERDRRSHREILQSNGQFLTFYKRGWCQRRSGQDRRALVSTMEIAELFKV